MNTLTLKESKPYTFNKLKNILACNNDSETQKMIDKLLLSNVLRKIKSNNSLELESLLELGSHESINSYLGEVVYTFKFVGVIMIKNKIFFIYPKYFKKETIEFDKNNEFIKFKQILNVIEKYKSKEQAQSISGEAELASFNLLSFTLDLIRDYHENGLYTNNKRIIDVNGEGEILWDKTINENLAYLSNGIPVYLDLFTENNIENSDNLFQRLHKYILSTCSYDINAVLKILNIDPIYISDEKLEDFGQKDYLIYKLKQELSQQFITKKQKIINKMLSYLNKNEVHNNDEEIYFVGTSSFNMVWEAICSEIKGNCLKKTLGELGLQYNNVSSSMRLIDLIPNPKWTYKASNVTHEVTGTLIPDVIHISNKELIIYDAKYYTIILNEKYVRHQPSIADITKQFLYLEAFKNIAKENNLKIGKNIFLMPYDGEDDIELGHVQFDLFLGSCINIKLLACEKAFCEYLNN